MMTDNEFVMLQAIYRYYKKKTYLPKNMWQLHSEIKDDLHISKRDFRLIYQSFLDKEYILRSAVNIRDLSEKGINAMKVEQKRREELDLHREVEKEALVTGIDANRNAARSARRSNYIALASVLLAAVSLVFSVVQYQQSQDDIEQLKQTNEDLQKQLDDINRFNEVKEEIRQDWERSAQ